MEVPKYIQEKIRQQSEAVIKAKKLQAEIENWCDKNGVNIYSEECNDCFPEIEEYVGAISLDMFKIICDEI